MSPRPQQLVGKVTSGVKKVRENGLAGDTTWGLIIEASQLVTSLITFWLLGTSLGKRGFGHYASMYAVMVPLGTLAASGVALSFLQHAIREKEDLNRVLRSCLSITLVFGLLLTVLGVGLTTWIVPALPIVSITCIALLEFVSAPIGQIAAAAVLVRTSYAKAAQVRLIPIVARLVVIVILYVLDELTIASLAVTFLAISALISFFTLRITAQRLDLDGRPGAIDRRHLRTSGVYSIGISGLSLQNDGDKAVLAAYRYEDAVGIYSLAYKVVQFGLLPVSTLAASSHQRFLEHTEGQRDQHLKRSLRFAMVTGAYGLTFAVGLMLIAPVLPALFGSEWEESVSAVRWLAPLVLLRGLAMFPLNGLMGLGKTFIRSGLLVGSALLSMVMYIVLVPLYTWKGAAIGTLVGETFLAAAAWYLLLVHQKRSNLISETAELVRRAGIPEHIWVTTHETVAQVRPVKPVRSDRKPQGKSSIRGTGGSGGAISSVSALADDDLPQVRTRAKAST